MSDASSSCIFNDKHLVNKVLFRPPPFLPRPPRSIILGRSMPRSCLLILMDRRSFRCRRTKMIHSFTRMYHFMSLDKPDVSIVPIQDELFRLSDSRRFVSIVSIEHDLFRLFRLNMIVPIQDDLFRLFRLNMIALL